MSKSKKNRSKVFLLLLAVVLLIGACFGSVGLYVKFELGKPKFELPETAQSVSALPETQGEVYNYISGLCEKVYGADNIEESVKTEVGGLDGDLKTPFSNSDNAVFKYIINNASGTFSGLYREYDGVKVSDAENPPQLLWSESLLTDWSASWGAYNDAGEFVDDDRYFIHLSFDPAENEYNADVLSEITKLLSPDLIIENAEVETKELQVDFEIDRFTDHILHVNITRRYEVGLSVNFSEKYAALFSNNESSALITLPYKTNEIISFNYYGAYFTKPCIAVKKGDVETLPASVTVKNDASKEDYELIFEVSDPQVIEIDEDGVMSVLKNSDSSVNVTMTLVYEGHTYTDDLTVYITELEVETDG
ncbi:MAG: hypothetical protein J1E34_06305 [Oscillospiraceae bacterium]|nr:hypothetical protein [Oscillospiraceae bacterium]